MLCSLEQIVKDGLIPGGMRSGRLHVHLSTTPARVREGSEIVIYIKTTALFLLTQKVYKTQAGVVLTPDVVPSSTFLCVRMNRPGGTEIWTSTRGRDGAGVKPGGETGPSKESSSSSSGLHPGPTTIASRPASSDHFVWLPRSAWKEMWHE